MKNPDGLKVEPYALYIIVEKGQLKGNLFYNKLNTYKMVTNPMFILVVHVFGKHLTSLIVGRGLNRDEWHNVDVRIDVHGGRLIAKVDQDQEEVYLKGLNHETNYGITTNLTSVVLVGGIQ